MGNEQSSPHQRLQEKLKSVRLSVTGKGSNTAKEVEDATANENRGALPETKKSFSTDDDSEEEEEEQTMLSEVEEEERAKILADAAALKKLAVDYAHPEVGIATTDPALFGRNYFERPSAPEMETPEEAEEHAKILADAAALKKLAVDHSHPEVGIAAVDPTAFGRNYFERPSAPAVETQEETEERAAILADASALKKLAVDYAHPEVGVITTDPTACGRNYFDRASAPGHTDISSYSELTEGGVQALVHPSISAPDDVAINDDIVKGMGLQQFHNTKMADKVKDVPSGGVEDEDENPARSPSSVMLFGLDSESAAQDQVAF